MKPIKIKSSHKGLLHRKLGIPDHQVIPVAKMDEIVNRSHSASLKKEAQFALNARKWKK